jgi:branched-chain amino acid transport system ATP-binding protein
VSDSDVALRVEGLDRWFGGVHAVEEIDLEVAAGAVHVVIGPNGSGKSTLFNLITGHTPPNAGRIWFHGEEITGLPYHKVVRRGLAKSYQITTLFPALSVWENVRVAAQSARSPYACWLPASRVRSVNRAAEEVLETLGLADQRRATAGNLSHGDQRKLDLAIALATRPRLVLLDEPTAGMSPGETAETVELVRGLTPAVTVLMVEHKMSVVLGMADRITVLHNGRKLFEGGPDEVSAHPKVQEVYLSGSL